MLGAKGKRRLQQRHVHGRNATAVARCSRSRNASGSAWPSRSNTSSAPLDRVRAADDLYFDTVSRIQVPTWSRGRIGLVGDAASCVSLVGDGSSLAMAGAFALADSLNGDIPAGLRTYEARHRPQRAAKEN